MEVRGVGLGDDGKVGPNDRISVYAEDDKEGTSSVGGAVSGDVNGEGDGSAGGVIEDAPVTE